MVKRGIVLGYIISIDSIEVDKAKINLSVNLPHPTYVKEIRSFLRHAGFCRRFIQDFNKITKPLSSPLANDVPFHFSKECLEAFTKSKDIRTIAHILHPPIWGECLGSNLA